MKNFKTEYGNLVIGEWPNTVAKNASGPGATDGTPYADSILNDPWGAIQDLLTEAGMTPDGIQEAAGSSQFMEAFRRGAGLPPGMIVTGFFSPARAAVMRVMPMEGQLAPVAAYPRLVDAVWQGALLNDTVPCLYRCDANGDRNAAGDFLYIPDARGLFFRNAGANSIVRPTGGTLYDGNDVGSFIGDAIRDITGTIYDPGSLGFVFPGTPTRMGALSLGQQNRINSTLSTGQGTLAYSMSFNASLAVPTAHENRSASVSVAVYISY